MPVSRQLSHRWSDEELVLATGDEGVTHLQHKLKLCSAYAGIPVSFLKLLVLSAIVFGSMINSWASKKP